MISQKRLVLIFITYTQIFFTMITGYPVEDTSLVSTTGPFEAKNETRYPNGTVVGEFSYKDDQGNPVNVKYYADEFNYGVELKSAQMIGTGKGTFWKASSFEHIQKSDELQPTTRKLNVAQEDNKKKMDSKKEGISADYEKFYRNDIKSLGQCEKDKVRVYLDREKKIIKRALENYEAAQSCERQ